MKKEEIILCTNCKGSGVLRFETLTDYHKGEYDVWYDVWYEDCHSCEGQGIIVKCTEVTYKPYKKPKVRNS